MSYAVDHASSRQNGWHYTQLAVGIKGFMHRKEIVCLRNGAPGQISTKKRWYGSGFGRI